jgi:hypothetical protein
VTWPRVTWPRSVITSRVFIFLLSDRYFSLNSASVVFTAHLHIAPRLRMNGATPLPPPPIRLNDVDRETLNAFTRFRKIAKSDYQRRRVCLSVRKEQLGSNLTDFHEI